MENLIKDIRHYYNLSLNGMRQKKCIFEIQGLLAEYDKYLLPKTNIVSLFPEGKPFIHINRSYFLGKEVNLNLTLTPSPSNKKSIYLIHPNIVINDDSENHLLSFLETGIKSAVLPVFRTQESLEECLRKTHYIHWENEKSLRLHPGDKIVFTSKADSTITSCNDKWQILVAPEYDLIILKDQNVDITLLKPGDYYFTSRHQKNIHLYIHVRNCRYHT